MQNKLIDLFSFILFVSLTVLPLKSEAGIGFERIPTFISNVIYFGAGAVWGVGPIASGKSGWYLDITFPF